MTKLLPDRIVKLEKQPLSENDKMKLLGKRNKQLKFLLLAYIPLVLILVFVFMNGLSIINRDRFPYKGHEITDDDTANFKLAVPYVCGFFFVMLTCYFISSFLKSVLPLIRDTKKNEKLLATVPTEKFDMGMLNKYFISTPVKRVRQVSVGKNDFYKLSETMPLIFELAPNSTEILRISQNGSEVPFY